MLMLHQEKWPSGPAGDAENLGCRSLQHYNAYLCRNRVAQSGPFPKHGPGGWFSLECFNFNYERPFVDPRGKKCTSPKKSSIEWTLPRRSDVHSKTLRMATCRFLTACHARPRKHVFIPLRWRCLKRLWSRIWSLSTSRLLRCLLLSSACRRNRRLVRGSARASLARQSWMPCGCSGRPRLGPASASS